MNSQFTRITHAVQEEIKKGYIRGANLSLIKDGVELYHCELGYADYEHKIPMKQDSIFRLFSMSKIITAAAAYLLLERGQLDLYDPVSLYLDGFKNQTVLTDCGTIPVKRDVTIKDLLSMTSGLCYPDECTEAGKQMAVLFQKNKQKLEQGISTSTIEFANQIGRLPLAFQPGERWMYGTSADILGAVIESIVSIPYGTFLEQEFFIPLGMVDTAFYVPAQKWDRFCTLYQLDPASGMLQPTYERFLGLDNYKTPPAFESGGAGLVSTITDYSKFALMLLQHGTHQGIPILSRKTIALLTQNQLTKTQIAQLDWDSLRGHEYGNFLRIMNDTATWGGLATKGEYGWDGWTGNYITINPEENMIFQFFIQRCDTGLSEVTRKIRNLVYASI